MFLISLTVVKAWSLVSPNSNEVQCIGSKKKKSAEKLIVLENKQTSKLCFMHYSQLSFLSRCDFVFTQLSRVFQEPPAGSASDTSTCLPMAEKHESCEHGVCVDCIKSYIQHKKPKQSGNRRGLLFCEAHLVLNLVAHLARVEPIHFRFATLACRFCWNIPSFSTLLSRRFSGYLNMEIKGIILYLTVCELETTITKQNLMKSA